jgi:hypothetical protein
MKKAMVWSIESPKKGAEIPLTEHIKSASSYYSEKYGETPDTCQVHPSVIENDVSLVAKVAKLGIALLPYKYVLKGYIHIGLDKN